MSQEPQPPCPTGGGKARGPDFVSYEDVLRIPNADLCALFQACVDARMAPSVWLTTTLAAVQKKGAATTDPAGYRNIGLESCLLKTLTLLIDRRLREWADSEDLFPPHQNGFRAGHRTENNVFILRTVIEQARANGRTVWVASIDLSNAFPSVDQDVMWAKLLDWGASGPLLDWLRMLYERMTYVVRFNGELSEFFRALAGILIGDPASPVLWVLFFADFTTPHCSDDVTLDGIRVPYLAQADDILLLAYSPAALQIKINALEQWCMRNGLSINVRKSLLMAFGPLPLVPPLLTLYGVPLTLTASATYVGVTLTTTTRNIFKEHRSQQASKARRLALASLSLEAYIGPLPPDIARTLYTARIEPHLLAAAMVDLDVDRTSLAELEQVQLTFVRRALQLPRHSPTLTPLLDIGLWPLRFRRAQTAIKYLAYLVDCPASMASAALRVASNLARAGHPSWISDLHHALSALPFPVAFDFRAAITSLSAQAMLANLSTALAMHARDHVTNATKLTAWREAALALLPPCPSSAALFKMREYLRIPNARMRKDVARLLAGISPCAVELLRHHQVPRDRRICRFCLYRDVIEDEHHILFACPEPTIQHARDEFYMAIMSKDPGIVYLRRRCGDWSFFGTMLNDSTMVHTTAAFVSTVFEHLRRTEPRLLATEEEFMALPLQPH